MTVLKAVNACGDWSFYDSMIAPRSPGDLAYLEGNNLFEDGEYQRALAKYDEALSDDGNHLHALHGRALSLMQLGQSPQALTAFYTSGQTNNF